MVLHPAPKLLFNLIQFKLITIQTHPILYLIRHGEKPPKEADGKDADGLSTQGLERAQYLVQVFGKSSQYNIQYILAEKPKKGT
jgi:hypothetical protein